MSWILGVSKLIPVVIGVVHAVEKIAGDKKGKEKQDAAVDAIGAMIGVLELSFDREIVDQEEFKVLLRRLIDDYVAIQNFAAKFKKG